MSSARWSSALATDKQVRYLMQLLEEAGYGIQYMEARYKNLGASMRERSGSVEAWLKSRSVGQASGLIDQLKAEAS